MFRWISVVIRCKVLLMLEYVSDLAVNGDGIAG
jgi:hypothetical protein